MNNSTEFQCIICGEGIVKEDPHDPCALFLVSNVDKSQMDQKEQTFFCHLNCFQASMKNEKNLYLRCLSTKREALEEEEKTTQQISKIHQDLRARTITDPLIQNLLSFSKGIWTPFLPNIPKGDELLRADVLKAETLLFPMYFMWSEIIGNSKHSTYIYFSDEPEDMLFSIFFSEHLKTN